MLIKYHSQNTRTYVEYFVCLLFWLKYLIDVYIPSIVGTFLRGFSYFISTCLESLVSSGSNGSSTICPDSIPLRAVDLPLSLGNNGTSSKISQNLLYRRSLWGEKLLVCRLSMIGVEHLGITSLRGLKCRSFIFDSISFIWNQM